jgi:hypothetical protein
MSIVERRELQAKGICNIFHKIITENFPKLEKVLAIQLQEASKKPNHLTKIETPQGTLSLKQLAQRTEKEY